MSDQMWLEDVVIVNESRDERRAGDISVFRSVGEACETLEHWWVENNEGFVFSASGNRLMLGVDANVRVVLTASEPHPHGSAIVTEWLNALAVSILEARNSQARQGKIKLGDLERVGCLPRTVEGLLAYVGFNS